MKAIEIEKLFRQHYSQMTKLARTMLYDDEEARDVVSEVFAALIRSDIVPVNIKTTTKTHRLLIPWPWATTRHSIRS